MKKAITITTQVNSTIDKIWSFWTTPEHIKQWNNASPDWHTPNAEIDLSENGTFNYTMAAKDGSFSFDLKGIFNKIATNQLIAYTLEDGRKVNITFEDAGDMVTITETFEAEEQNPIEMQEQGWQAILNNFKAYTESN